VAEPSEDWGPWNPRATDRERDLAVATLRTVACLTLGPDHPLSVALTRAYHAQPDALGMVADALCEAGRELGRLPALARRHLLARYGTLVAPPPVGRDRHGGRGRKAAAAKATAGAAA
jgi:hypothetical protein